MEDLQFEAEFLTWDQASQNSLKFACHLTSTIGIRVSWDPFNHDWIASAANTELTQVMIDTQHSICIQLNNVQMWATVVEIREEGKWVNMQTEYGETFLMKTEGQDITSGYPTLREAIQRTSPTLVRLSQLTEPNRVYGLEEKRQGKRKIGWSQAIYPLRARLQELKSHLLLEKGDEALEDEFMELKSGEHTRPKLIQAGYTTLDSIPRLKKRSGTRSYCPALKGVDSRTQDKVSKWIQLLHK